jgi:hypothetical protein
VRQVHALKRSAKNPAVLISFIQHGNREEGWKYEVICPFCAKTIGWFDDLEDELTEYQVDVLCKQEMREHISFCPHAGQSLGVEVTTEPLGTESHPPRIM